MLAHASAQWQHRRYKTGGPHMKAVEIVTRRVPSICSLVPHCRYNLGVVAHAPYAIEKPVYTSILQVAVIEKTRCMQRPPGYS